MDSRHLTLLPSFMFCAPAVLNASAAKAPSPVFVLPTSQPKTSGYMHMRMHSSMQSK